MLPLFERLYSYREEAGKNGRKNFLTELLAAALGTSQLLCQQLCAHANLPPSPLRIRT